MIRVHQAPIKNVMTYDYHDSNHPIAREVIFLLRIEYALDEEDSGRNQQAAQHLFLSTWQEKLCEACNIFGPRHSDVAGTPDVT